MSILIGSEGTQAQAKRALGAISWSLWISVLVLLLTFISLNAWHFKDFKTNPQVRAEVVYFEELAYTFLASLYPKSTTVQTNRRITGGVAKKVNTKKYIKWLVKRLDGLKNREITYVKWSGLAGALIIFLMIVWFRKFSKSASARRNVRGAELVKPAMLKAWARKKRGKSRYTVAGIPIPEGAECQHSMYTGTTGAGKSQAVMDRIAQLRKRGEQAIIFDPDRELIEKFFQPGDKILNPFDARSEIWDIRSEVRIESDAEAIATSLIQPNADEGGQNNKFFYDAGASIVAAVLQNTSMKNPYAAIAKPRTEELGQQLGAPHSNILDDKSGREIHKTILTKMNGFKYQERLLESLPAGQPAFSIRNWVNDGNGILWLTSRDDVHSSLQPMLSLWIEIAAIQLLSRSEGEGAPMHIIIDELAALNKMPALLRLLARGRKKKVSVLLASQSPGQQEAIYGKEGAMAMNDTIGTRLVVRLEHPDSAEFASRLLGECEIDEQKQSLNFGGRKQGTNLNQNRARERIVMPAEIQSLPDLTAYIKIGGGSPTAKVTFKYKERKAVVVGFIEAELNSKPIVKSPPPPEPRPRATKSDPHDVWDIDAWDM
jgi:type IV secretory pathway TraG/TraD family ATPase VirD4